MDPKPALHSFPYWLAAVGPLLFLLVATIEGALRGGYDPIAQPISALAIGPRGWVQQLNFALLTASFGSFALVLKANVQGGGATLGASIFWLMTIGVGLAGVFVMDAIGAPPTTAGRIHEAAGFLVFPWIPVVLLVLARSFRHDAAWRPYFKPTLFAGLLCLALMVFFLLFVGTPSASPRLASAFRGLVQRLVLTPFFVWIALVARRAYFGASAVESAVQ